jgi:hypothetical protein
MESKEEKKAKKEAERLAKEQAKKEAEEAKKAKEEEKKAKKEAERLAKEQAKKEAEEIDITATGETVKREQVKKRQKLYKGEVNLLFQPPVDSKNLESLKNSLNRLKGLRILITGGTADGGIQMVVSTSKPIPLLTHLREAPEVEKAVSKNDTFYILLK